MNNLNTSFDSYVNEIFGIGNPKFIIGNTYIHRPKNETPYRMIYQGKTKDTEQEIFKREDNGQLLYFFPNYIKGEVFKNSKNLEPWWKNESLVKENILPKPFKKVKCQECGEDVCDNINYKIGHLYNKHNCKPSVDDYKAKRMLKQYFN